MMCPPKPLFARSCAGAGVLALAASASAQVQFSINPSSESIGRLDAFGDPISEGDLLGPAGGSPAPGPVGAPEIDVDSLADLMLMAGAEQVDALSRGQDFRIPGPLQLPGCRVWFSANRAASSHVPIPNLAPTIWSEGIAAGQEEVGADVYVDRNLIGMLPASPIGIVGTPAHHIGLFDGDGLAGAFGGSSFPGLGLIEPSPIGVAGGDNLDALDGLHDAAAMGGPIYFSLHNASAAAYGFEGADVLVATVGGPALWVDAMFLGLDRQGDGTDELDALVLWENGNGQYDPSPELFSWSPQGGDMLLFSVTAGSAVIGQPDSIFGQPIEAGDLLVPAPNGQSWPGIFIAAERLGLATLRAGYSEMDNLDAADIVAKPYFDCDGNQIEDACQISAGQLPDVDQNGIADPCDAPGGPTFYCTPKTSSNGCLTTLTTTDPIAQPVSGANDYEVAATAVKGFANGIFFFGVNGAAAIPFAGGTLCMTPPLGRLPIQNSLGSGPLFCDGKLAQIINDGGATSPNLDAGPGTSNWLQAWYRDPMNGAGPNGSALSDAVEVTYQ